jgi:hypothetical protein
VGDRRIKVHDRDQVGVRRRRVLDLLDRNDLLEMLSEDLRQLLENLCVVRARVDEIEGLGGLDRVLGVLRDEHRHRQVLHGIAGLDDIEVR